MTSLLGRSSLCQAARQPMLRWKVPGNCRNQQRNILIKKQPPRALSHPPSQFHIQGRHRLGLIQASADGASSAAPAPAAGDTQPGTQPKPNIFQKILLFLSSVSPKAESGQLLKATFQLLKKYWWALLLLFLARDGLQFLLHRITHRLTNLAAEAVFEYPMSSLVINPWWLVLDAEFLEQHSGYQLMMVVFFVLALPFNLLLNCGSTAIMMLLCTKQNRADAAASATTASATAATLEAPSSTDTVGSDASSSTPTDAPAGTSTPPKPDPKSEDSDTPAATSATPSSSALGNGADALTTPPAPPSPNGSSSTGTSDSTGSTSSTSSSLEKSNGDSSSPSSAAPGLSAGVAAATDGSISGMSSSTSSIVDGSSTSTNGGSKGDGAAALKQLADAEAAPAAPAESATKGLDADTLAASTAESDLKGKGMDASATSSAPAESAAPVQTNGASTSSSATGESSSQEKTSDADSKKEGTPDAVKATAALSPSSTASSSPATPSPSTSKPVAEAPIKGPRHAFSELKSMMPEVWSIMGRIWWVELLASGASLVLQGLMMLIIPVIWTLPWLLSIQLALAGAVLKGHKGLDALRQSHETMAGYRPAYFWPFMTLLVAVRIVDTLRAGAFALMPNRYWTDAIEIPIIVYVLIALLRFAVCRLQDLLPLAAYLRITSGTAVKVPTPNTEASQEQDSAAIKPVPSTAL